MSIYPLTITAKLTMSYSIFFSLPIIYFLYHPLYKTDQESMLPLSPGSNIGYCTPFCLITAFFFFLDQATFLSDPKTQRKMSKQHVFDPYRAIRLKNIGSCYSINAGGRTQFITHGSNKSYRSIPQKLQCQTFTTFTKLIILSFFEKTIRNVELINLQQVFIKVTLTKAEYFLFYGKI